MTAAMDDLVERIRAVAYEKNYGSHSAWAKAVRSMFAEVCGGCGLNPDQDHDDIVHEDGTTAYQPMIFLRNSDNPFSFPGEMEIP